MASYKITVSANSGTGGLAAFYYDTATAKFYETTDFTKPPITSVRMHTRTNYASLGYRSSNSDTDTVRVNPDGTIADGWKPTAAATIYARWSQVSYTVTINANGGEAAVLMYAKKGASPNEFYADDLCTVPLASVGLTGRVGYTVKGAYSAASGGTAYIDGTGAFLSALLTRSITAALTIYHQWTANKYTITFDYNGGSGTPATKQVTFGSAVGTLPAPTMPRAEFSGWTVDGNPVTASTVMNIAADIVLRANWNLVFGRVVDYFGLASSWLKPVSSESGDNKQRVCCANAKTSGSKTYAGWFSSGVAVASSVVWRNPTVRYEVCGDGTLALNLGKAFAKASGLTGYMITGVRVETSFGKFPTVTVTGTANEGVNAINQFPVSIPIVGRARAQNLLSATTGGGLLHACSVSATCNPVVCAENMVPCASDVVEGRYVAEAEFAAPEGEAAPTAGSGWASLGEPKSCGDKAYPLWKIQLQKEIV